MPPLGADERRLGLTSEPRKVNLTNVEILPASFAERDLRDASATARLHGKDFPGWFL
jgi:hypothetical protein